MIANLKALGKTVFLTTHYMDEAQSLSDHVAIIVDGGIVAEGPPEILVSRDRTTTVRFRVPNGAPPLPGEILKAASVERSKMELRTEHPTRLLHALTSWAMENSVELDGLTVTRASLEDVYLELTRGGSEDVRT
jgi:ABC-2 type transport system ATP-binding protein